jgi:hypothetical protein
MTSRIEVHPGIWRADFRCRDCGASVSGVYLWKPQGLRAGRCAACNLVADEEDPSMREALRHELGQRGVVGDGALQ